MSAVLVVTSSFPRWPDDSAGRFVAASVQGLRQAGIPCQVLAPCDAQSRPQPGLGCFNYASGAGAKLAYGAGIMPNLAADPTLLRQAPSLVLRMAQAIRQHKARHVLAHWLVPAGLSALLAGVQNLIIIVHGSDLALLEHLPLGASLARFIAARADALIFVSEDLRRRFHKLSGLTTGEVLPPTTFAPAAMTREQAFAQLGSDVPDGQVLLFVGRMVAGKGLASLLSAFKNMPDNVQLWLAGDGALREKMRALAARLHIQDRLRFWGHVAPSQLAALYVAADVLLMPSQPRIKGLGQGHAEGFPTVLIEAMAAALPVVATRVGGVPDLLEHAHNALLVQPGDLRALARETTRIVSDKKLAQALALQAQSDVQELLPAAHGRRLAALLAKYWGRNFARTTA